MIVLRLHNISKKRGRDKHAVAALNHVSLQVKAGEFIIIEGPSGVGKTTLLAVSAGLLQPDTGTVSLAEANLQKLTAAYCRKHRSRAAGFIFQRSNLLDGITVRDNVRIMASIADLPPDQAEETTNRLLDSLGLSALADRSTDSLSGGEEQRVAVARALVHKPAVVFADEPTGNLDTHSGKAVADLLKSTAKHFGSAVLVTTHDHRLAKYASRRFYMIDGQLKETS